jgi:peptide/nickel transport system permease protein
MLKTSRNQRDAWRRFKRNRMAVVGLFLISFFILISVFADVLVPYKLGVTQDKKNRMQAPNLMEYFNGETTHLLGTDDIGRDLFARLVHGSRVSLSIGLLSTLLGMSAGSIIGAACAYYGGWFDNLIMRISDVLFCIPFILMAMMLISVFGTGMQNLILAMFIASVPSYAKTTRAAVLSVVNQDYIEAARASGTSTFLIILRHILPNIVSVLVIGAVFSIAGNMLSAAGLSFLGLGVKPPQPEWGTLLAEGKLYMRSNPYMIFIPGLCITLATLGITLTGDGLRDAFDPRLKQ